MPAADSRSELSQAVLRALRGLTFEDLPKDVVALGLVDEPRIRGDRVVVPLRLPSPAHPATAELAERVRAAVSGVEGVGAVEVEAGWRVPESDFAKAKVPGVREVIVVASGKGGVGKSTVAANLAIALARLGAAVGLGDLDIYGPSVPVVLGSADPAHATDDQRLLPATAHGIRFLSMGQMAGAGRAVLWRGPMLHQMAEQIVRAAWSAEGDLDYLVLDLPPGTGDVQLTVVQSLPVTGAVIVTTPQEIALIDARKGLTMFRDNKIEILGIVENMAWYACRKCGKRHWVFGREGGRRLADDEGVPLLAQIPLDPATRAGGDDGRPPALLDGGPGDAWRDLAIATAARAGNLSLRRNPFRVLA